MLIQQNGFITLAESNMLRNNVDDHTLAIGHPALGRYTDQFFQGDETAVAKYFDRNTAKATDAE